MGFLYPLLDLKQVQINKEFVPGCTDERIFQGFYYLAPAIFQPVFSLAYQLEL